jgi:hypothetical protein
LPRVFAGTRGSTRVYPRKAVAIFLFKSFHEM